MRTKLLFSLGFSGTPGNCDSVRIHTPGFQHQPPFESTPVCGVFFFARPGYDEQSETFLNSKMHPPQALLSRTERALWSTARHSCTCTLSEVVSEQDHTRGHVQSTRGVMMRDTGEIGWHGEGSLPANMDT